MNGIGMYLSAIVLAVLSSGRVMANTTYSDGTFANWNTTAFAYGNGGATSSSQMLLGGNPDDFLQINTTVNAAGGQSSIVHGYHLSNSLTYSPSESGAIQSLTFATDTATTGGQVGIGLAIEQNGKFFFGAYGINDHSGWLTINHADLTADAFTPETNGALDFSPTAPPLTFGYFTANSADPGFGGYSTVAKLDNFSLTVVTPEPSSLVLLPAGGIIMMRRRARMQKKGRRGTGVILAMNGTTPAPSSPFRNPPLSPPRI